LTAYIPIIDDVTVVREQKDIYQLSDMQLAFWRTNSYLRVSNLLAYEGIDSVSLSAWVAEISAWPKDGNDEAGNGRWLMHYELSNAAAGVATADTGETHVPILVKNR